MERVIFSDTENGEEYEFEYAKSELSALAAEAMTRGINNATEGGDAGTSSPLAETQGWSNGYDSRVMKPVNTTYPINHRVLMRMGEVDNCTRTLIGRRLVLTAAHCVVSADLQVHPHVYRPRRSGTLTPPYGTPTSVGMWWSGNCGPNNCHVNPRQTVYRQHDWAILLLPNNAWASSPNGTPGYMGYWIPGQSYIAANAVCNNDGYPACSSEGAPTNCQDHQVYGQTFGSAAVGFADPHDGIPSFYRVGNDVSGGHSGSAIWTDYPGANGPYVIGIAINEVCAGANCVNQSGDFVTHPNGVRGMTPFLANFITSQRVAYP